LKVLLTGANGFVGSHVLDALQARGVPTAILLRGSSNRDLIQRHIPAVETRIGSITDPVSLGPVVKGITHVIHCAGCTKAVHLSDYRKINHEGTTNLVEAVNGCQSAVQRFIHVSSLAASGPATPDQPASEDSTPSPVSEYGRSKLAGESEVRNHCRAPFTIMRPPAVYGPRDTAFLPMFKAVKNHVLPRPGKRQALSLVFARDLAEAIATCLDHPLAAGKTYFVSSREVVTGRGLAELISQRMRVWALPIPLPTFLFWPICLLQELFAKLTGRPAMLNLQKFAELRAPGWVCDPSRLERELGIKCLTPLSAGLPETLDWYQQHKLL
jgi:nucleoside-diphosphate-sugar epimerase